MVEYQVDYGRQWTLLDVFVKLKGFISHFPVATPGGNRRAQSGGSAERGSQLHASDV